MFAELFLEGFYHGILFENQYVAIILIVFVTGMSLCFMQEGTAFNPETYKVPELVVM